VSKFEHIHKMMNFSEKIVNISQKISSQSRMLIAKLVELDDAAGKIGWQRIRPNAQFGVPVKRKSLPPVLE